MKSVPSVAREQLRGVDRLMIEKYRIVLLQTMENDGRSGAALRSLVDEKSTGRRTLRTNDVERCAHQKVAAGRYAAQVQPLEDDHTADEQRLVHLVGARPESLDGEVVDAHQPYAALGKLPGGVGGQGDEIGVELWVISVGAVSRLEEEALAITGDGHRFQVCSGDVSVTVELGHVRWADQRVQRQPLYAVGAVEEVRGCVDMGPRVRPEREDAHCGRVAFRHELTEVQCRPDVALVGGHVRNQRDGDAVDLHGSGLLWHSGR